MLIQINLFIDIWSWLNSFVHILRTLTVNSYPIFTHLQKKMPLKIIENVLIRKN